MTGTSGTSTFNETRDTIITNALQLLNVTAAGETANANDITFGASILNAMVKAWQAQGIHLWTEEEGTIFFNNLQAEYNLALGNSTNASDGSGTPVETTTAASTSNGASTITCTTVVGMTVADVIGLEQDNNTILWSTISAINTSTNVVTLNTTTTDSAASGNQVYTYTTQLGRPLTVNSARVRDNNGFDRRIKILPRDMYMQIPQKTLVGTPVVCFYTPQLTQGQVFLWPTPNDVTQRLKITYLRTIQDFDAGTDNPDFPQEWLEAITYNLAVRLAPSYGINLASGGITGNPGLITQAAQYLDDMKAWDAEQPWTLFVPNYRYYR